MKSRNRTHSFAKKLPIYYALVVGVFLILFFVYKQSEDIGQLAQKDASLAASNSQVYRATSAINQDGNPSYDPYDSRNTLWFGNGKSRDASYLGLYFSNVQLPPASQIGKVRLRVTAQSGGWVSQSVRIYAEKSSSPSLFSRTALPGGRTVTAASVSYSDNVNWTKDQSYSFPDITSLIKEISRGTDQNVALIIKGTGVSYGRKFIYPVSSDRAPRLIIEANTGGISTASPVPTNSTVPPIGTLRPTVSSTPRPSSSVQPTSTPIAQPPATVPSGTLSMAMGKWSPSRFDTCTKIEHDNYSVLGPDGKRYPTWHPPTMRRSDGTMCSFGHDHGRNPSGYAYWDDVRRHFAFDADRNGSISSTELASSGIPFGYVNEQIDAHSVHTGATLMRHEDHVGHKVEYANGEGDIGEGTDPFDSNKTGGIVVPVKNTSGATKWRPSGVRCYHFHKVHQGVSTPDALTNNIHEVVMHAKCDSTLAQYPSSSSIISGMLAFGAPGEFTRFCTDNRTQTVRLGTTETNQQFPGMSGVGQRNIVTRDCVEQAMLVNAGSFSSFPYEIWDGGLTLKTNAGRTIASNNGAWEVLDAIRYYNPNSPNRISYMADVCYEILGSRRARGGTCDFMTNYGAIRGITWDDPRSEFRGLHRGQYINAPVLSNAGGAQVWYTDAFGGKGQTTPFPGSVKQYISSVNANFSGLDIDPRITLRRHDDGVINGKSTVHAPN